MTSYVFFAGAAVFITFGRVEAHMELMSPAPRNSKYNPFSTTIDYSMNSPLLADGSNLMCKRYAAGEFAGGVLSALPFIFLCSLNACPDADARRAFSSRRSSSPGAPVTTLVAGTTFSVALAGTTFHGGGHCQISIAYDSAPTTFIVLREDLIGCLVNTGTIFAVTLPASTPACSHCTLSWR